MAAGNEEGAGILPMGPVPERLIKSFDAVEYGRITVAGGGNQHDLLVLFPHGAADGVKTIDNGLQLRGEAPVIDG